jgi:hypothetical protein
MECRRRPEDTGELLHKDQEGTSPERLAVDLMRRPQVVGCQEYKEDIKEVAYAA